MRFSVVTLVLVLLTACQPVPRPFQHDRLVPNELLRLSDARAIKVLPVEDAPANTANALADRMVEALIERNVPAYKDDADTSGMVLVSALADPGYDAKIVWVLFNPDGEEIGRHEQSIEGTPIEPWARAEPELMSALAGAAAARVSRWVQPELVREVQAPPIYVGDVTGTNEKDAGRLRVALKQALRSMGTRTADAASERTLIASANVEITALRDTRKEVAIAWRIEDPFGTEIGKIDQASPVPGEMVDSQWGQLARQAGLAAAAGISELISRIDWRDGFVPPPGKSPES